MTLTLTINNELDRKNTYCNNNSARDELENIMEEFYLKDVWRSQYPQEKEFSWLKIGREVKASRIDFALVSAGLDQYVLNPMYKSGIFTDHRAFYMAVDLAQFERG